MHKISNSSLKKFNNKNMKMKSIEKESTNTPTPTISTDLIKLNRENVLKQKEAWTITLYRLHTVWRKYIAELMLKSQSESQFHTR